MREPPRPRCAIASNRLMVFICVFNCIVVDVLVGNTRRGQMLDKSRGLRRWAHLIALLTFVSAVVGGATPRAALAQDDVLEANKQLVAMAYEEIVNNRNF